MATYTSNYNLYMPDPTDPLEDFRTEHNNNMEIIDQNMGGGGGGSSTLAGLTDVSLSAPTNGQVLSYNSVLQKWENTNGGGGGGDTYNVYGAFIDTNNVIKASTTAPAGTVISYTATEDCAFIGGYYANATDGYIRLNGVNVSTVYIPTNSLSYLGETVLVRAGQTVTMKSNTNDGSYAVYGLIQGTNQVGEHYSTSEQVIGTWSDGKPLYRQTITFNTGVVPSNIGVNITSYMPANCVVVDTSFFIEYSYEGIDYRNVNVNGGYTTENTTHYFYFSIGSAQYDKHVELTIKYTKTTD